MDKESCEKLWFVVRDAYVDFKFRSGGMNIQGFFESRGYEVESNFASHWTMSFVLGQTICREDSVLFLIDECPIPRMGISARYYLKLPLDIASRALVLGYLP